MVSQVGIRKKFEEIFSARTLFSFIIPPLFRTTCRHPARLPARLQPGDRRRRRRRAAPRAQLRPVAAPQPRGSRHVVAARRCCAAATTAAAFSCAADFLAVPADACSQGRQQIWRRGIWVVSGGTLCLNSASGFFLLLLYIQIAVIHAADNLELVCLPLCL